MFERDAVHVLATKLSAVKLNLIGQVILCMRIKHAHGVVIQNRSNHFAHAHEALVYVSP